MNIPLFRLISLQKGSVTTYKWQVLQYRVFFYELSFLKSNISGYNDAAIRLSLPLYIFKILA